MAATVEAPTLEPPAARVLLISNPSSGSGAGARAAAELADAFERAGARLTRSETRPASEGDVFAEVDPGEHDAIVVVGGDGTFHAAVNGLPALTTPLAFLGVGTINVLARELRLPSCPDLFAGMVLAGKTLRIPLLRANERRFVLFAEAGFMARIVQVTNALRERVLRRHGRLEFVLATLAVLPLAWGRRVRVEAESADGSTLRREYSNVLITRARCYGGGIEVPMQPGFDVPLAAATFELIGFRSLTPFGHLLVIVLGGLGLWPRWESRLARWGLLERVRVARARVESARGLSVHADAESLVPAGPERSLLEVGPGGDGIELIVP